MLPNCVYRKMAPMFSALVFLVTLTPTLRPVLGESCSEHFTCISPDRTTDHLQFLKLNSSVPNWYELCNCDSYCHIFGDCCSDAPVLSQIQLDEWSFVKIRLTSKITFMSLMKNKCPAQWKRADNVKENCEKSALSPMYDYLLPDIEHLLMVESEDEFANWHVTSRQSLVTYRNLYCSICNEDQEVEAWNQRLRCSSPSDDKSDNKCTTVFYQTAPDILGKEKLKRTPLQNKVYSNCNLGWYKMYIAKQQNYVFDTVKKCLLFYEPVVVRDPKSKKFIIFKNKHCALCNDFDVSTHQCPSEAIDQLTQVPATFNLISGFDTNYQEGSSIPDTNQTCTAGMVYNPLSSSCQVVIKAKLTQPKVAPSSNSLAKIGSSASSLHTPIALIFIALPLFFHLIAQ